jgi:hypothetical protein
MMKLMHFPALDPCWTEPYIDYLVDKKLLDDEVLN